MPDLDRRRFLGAAAATVAASQLGLITYPLRLAAMTGAMTETMNDGAPAAECRSSPVSCGLSSRSPHRSAHAHQGDTVAGG